MKSNHNSRIEIDIQQWSGFFDELRSETDRGATILAGVWIDELLKRKLSTLFTEGNSDARRKLFDFSGPFAAFSSKILAAYCLGWIDSDIHHDIDLLRKIRNLFAHELHGLNLESPRVRQLIDKFKVPHRHYDDWKELQAAATVDGRGFVLYTGEPPDKAGEPLKIQTFRYKWIVSVLVAAVAASLDLAVRVQDAQTETNPDLGSDPDRPAPKPTDE